MILASEHLGDATPARATRLLRGLAAAFREELAELIGDGVLLPTRRTRGSRPGTTGRS